MTTREMVTQYKMAQWAQIMQERTASGLSIRSYCDHTASIHLLAEEVA